jgi:hypothetical protein
MEIMFIKKCYLFMVGSVCRVKRFITGSRNYLMDIRKSQMMSDQVRKWLRAVRRLTCCGFRRTGKAMGQVLSGLVGDMARNKCFPSGPNILRFISVCDLFTDSALYLISLH